MYNYLIICYISTKSSIMKRRLLLLVMSALYLNLTAQIEFTENVVIDTSLFIESPQAVFPADLDGDGDMDILASSYFGDELVWFENLDGTSTNYQKQIISSTIPTPWGVHAADLDADGDLDVVAASLSGDVLIWYENTNGNANFVQKQIISAFEVEFVKTVDIEGDGDLDIVWSSRLDGKIKYTRNTDGLGTFAGTLNIENNVSSIPNFHLADIDGDGATDIVSSWFIQGGSQGVSWYKNPNGSGSFGSRLVVSSMVSGVTSVYAGDLDSDGDMDVAAALSGDEKIVWYENLDGIGTFGPEQILSNTAVDAFQVRIADFDADGDLDVISASNGDGEITWFENIDGLGTFSNEIFVSPFLGNMRSIEIADIDGDNDLDFVAATDQDNNIKWFENTNGLGDFSSYTITKNISGGKVVHASDLDGDGDLDLLSASHWDDKLAWYENKNGQGDYSDTQIIISETLNGAGGVVAADIDGDGDNDVVATSSLDDDVVWFENLDGLANFGDPQIIETELNTVNKVYAADLDGDTDIDVICTARGKIIWYENLDGQGNFSTQQEIESINNFFMEAIDIADLDGDGDLDISAASNYGLLYFINQDGQGNFGERQTIEDFTFDGFATKIADIDGDGDNDIVYSGENTSTDYLGWSENMDGMGTFSDIQLITTVIPNPKDLSVYDLDNDGDLDIVSSSWTGSSIGGVIAWYQNLDGQGDFTNTQQVISTNTGSPWDFNLFKADVNQDGFTDIVSINNLDDKILWFNNTGVILTNEITGTVRFDLLGDGCTTEDELLSGILFIAEGSSTTEAAFSQENGQFSILTTEEGVIETQITSQLPNYYIASPLSFQSDFTEYGNIDIVDFCIEPIGAINDLSISVYPAFNDPRPGFDTNYHIVYRNVGTTQLSGSINFEFDGAKLNFLTASESVSAQASNSLTFDFTSLNPFEVRTIDLEFNVFPPPTTNIDDVLLTAASINPTVGDITEEDNTLEIEQIVIGSYDPNDIIVLQGDEILIDDSDKYLNYLIRFQNTGTASAINVRVEHVLDDKLDWTTMELESLSHSGRVEISDGSDVQFIFDNINLPDSTTDEVGSNGFIAFRIKPKSDVEIGDIISGVADIYFDFNPPIITNTVNTQIVAPLTIDEFGPQTVQIYPNPVKDELNVSSNNIINNLIVIDLKGRELVNMELNAFSYNLDVSNLSEGVYFLEIVSGRSKTAKKFIKN